MENADNLVGLLLNQTVMQTENRTVDAVIDTVFEILEKHPDRNKYDRVFNEIEDEIRRTFYGEDNSKIDSDHSE